MKSMTSGISFGLRILAVVLLILGNDDRIHAKAGFTPNAFKQFIS